MCLFQYIKCSIYLQLLAEKSKENTQSHAHTHINGLDTHV